MGSAYAPPSPRECAIGGQRASSRGARHHCGSLQGREIIDKDSARAQPGRRHVLAGTLHGWDGKGRKKGKMEGGRIVKEGNVQGVSDTENKSNPSKGSHQKLCLICGVVGCAQSALARQMGKVGPLACALAHSHIPRSHEPREAGADPQ